MANKEVLPINDPAPAKPTPLLHFSSFFFHQRRRSCEICLRTTVPSPSCCSAIMHRTPLCITMEVSTCWKVHRWPVVLINRRLASTPATGGFHNVNPGALDVVHLQHWLLLEGVVLPESVKHIYWRRSLMKGVSSQIVQISESWSSLFNQYLTFDFNEITLAWGLRKDLLFPAWHFHLLLRTSS